MDQNMFQTGVAQARARSYYRHFAARVVARGLCDAAALNPSADTTVPSGNPSPQ